MQKRIVDVPCRAIVPTDTAQTFCAGGDISQMTPPVDMIPNYYSISRMKALHDCVRPISAGPKPVVAAVESQAAGAGVSLAAASEYIVAAEDSRFVSLFGKTGLPAPLAIALTKRVMARELDNLDVALDSEIEWQAELRATADHQEARDAFLQKRPPVFQGR